MSKKQKEEVPRVEVKVNSEILFLYDAKMCNPNGDPDDENRPRMDQDRERCLVSDVRLKRYVREYMEGGGMDIYVTRSGGVMQAGDRLKKVLGKDKVSKQDLPALLSSLVDVRLFGATMPIKGEKRGQGEAVSLTGPVQFNWGFSLNQVQEVDSHTITSQFSSRDQAGQGTFGKDYRLYYALVGFHGIVSARWVNAMLDFAGGKIAGVTSESDLEMLDKAMVKAIPLMATRSKIGQYPRLYARFVFNSPEVFMGDPREDLALTNTKGLRDIKDYTLELDGLAPRIGRVKGKIEEVLLWQDQDLQTRAGGKEVSAADWLKGILGEDRVKGLGGDW